MKFNMQASRCKFKKYVFIPKLIYLTLLGIGVAITQAYELIQAFGVDAQPLPVSNKIKSGKYWIGGVGMALFVEGDRYYSDENGQTEWRPISRLKCVQDGVVFGEGYYWCQSTLPGPRGICTPLGWTNPTTNQEMRCNEALIAAHRTLINVKNLTSLRLAPVKVGAHYPDNPTGHPDGYTFLLAGRGCYQVLVHPN